MTDIPLKYRGWEKKRTYDRYRHKKEKKNFGIKFGILTFFCAINAHFVVVLYQKSISTNGFPGIPGSNGMPGVPGIPGPQGPQGRDGAKGETGDKGSQGLLGQKGDEGNEGPRGKNGPPGMMGIKGAQGTVGDQGRKGDKGEKGESVRSPSSAVPQTNWKQCVWNNLNDDRDSGKIKVRAEYSD